MSNLHGGPGEEVIPRLLSREFLTLGLSTMLFFGAMGAVNPLLPEFVKDELGGSDTEVGIVFGVVAVASVLVRPVFGRLGDRRGPRLLVIVGCGFGFAGMLGYLLVDSVLSAIIARLPFGIATAAVMTGATTLAIDLSPEERRGEAASYILVAFHFGLGLGPLFGEFVRDSSSYDGAWVALSVLMAIGALVAVLLPRRHVEHDGEASPLLHPAGVIPGFVIGLAMMGFIGFSAFVPLYAEAIGVGKVGGIFMVSSISIALVRIFASKAPDRLGPIVSSTIALVMIIGGTVVLAAWASVYGLYVGAVVLAGGGALIMPALVPVVVADVEPSRRSSAMATFTMFIDVAVAVTGPIFGLTASALNYRAMFSVGGLTAATSLAVLWFALRPRWEHRRPEVAAPLPVIPPRTFRG